ncbi:MAG: winged helix-turn-helix domain-containing protein [Chloroflexota bacterium]|nr:winged helix-turn-helix domain-containing protein [Chloroflexota bacterium]
MPGDVDIASIAALLADPTRSNILLVLSDGRALPAGELARGARVSPSTASAHLARLMEAGLLAVEKQGRHRYFRLADLAIVQALEALALVAPPRTVHSLREADVADAVRQARTCYNHLAGALGVALTQALVDKQFLSLATDGYAVTDCGERWFRDFGIDCAALKRPDNLFAPHHIDWSERRYHLAGALGAAFTRRLFDLGWLTRAPSSRAVRLTASGREAILAEFELHL